MLPLSVDGANVRQHCLTSPSYWTRLGVLWCMKYMCVSVHSHIQEQSAWPWWPVSIVFKVFCRCCCLGTRHPLVSRSSLGTWCHVCSWYWSALLHALPLLLLFYKIKFLLYATQFVSENGYFCRVPTLRENTANIEYIGCFDRARVWESCTKLSIASDLHWSVWTCGLFHWSTKAVIKCDAPSAWPPAPDAFVMHCDCIGTASVTGGTKSAGHYAIPTVCSVVILEKTSTMTTGKSQKMDTARTSAVMDESTAGLSYGSVLCIPRRHRTGFFQVCIDSNSPTFLPYYCCQYNCQYTFPYNKVITCNWRQCCCFIGFAPGQWSSLQRLHMAPRNSNHLNNGKLQSAH